MYNSSTSKPPIEALHACMLLIWGPTLAQYALSLSLSAQNIRSIEGEGGEPDRELELEEGEGWWREEIRQP
jgi:hypothetical protein